MTLIQRQVTGVAVGDDSFILMLRPESFCVIKIWSWRWFASFKDDLWRSFWFKLPPPERTIVDLLLENWWRRLGLADSGRWRSTTTAVRLPRLLFASSDPVGDVAGLRLLWILSEALRPIPPGKASLYIPNQQFHVEEKQERNGIIFVFIIDSRASSRRAERSCRSATFTMTGLTQMKGAIDERVDERVAHPEEEDGRLKLLSQL